MRVLAGNINDIQGKRSRTVRVGDMEIALFKLSNGGIRAIENRCPHKGGKLSEGIVSEHFVFCPLHDWKINMDDGKVQAPDDGCILTYPTDVDSVTGDIYIHIEEIKNHQAS
ncbi:nitrite reductase small subunit NirD [Marinicrinis lubricantis]|uniref:Nitrite reductase small subunit NirD n=1 Tax=Marinicrinis lubricantis TaxID=2086470 RepID=A0ABW1IPS3_9BACL